MKLRFFGSLVHRAAAALALCAPPALAVTFSTDFAAGNPAGSALRGHATVTGGALALTTATASQLGSWVLDDFTGGRKIAEFEASFTILMGTGTGGGISADGLSFNWATDLPAGAFDEEGAGTGLTVTFDTHNNGFHEAPAIDIRWNGIGRAHSAVPFDFSAAATAPVPVTISLSPAGTVTVTFNGVTVHSDVALPDFLPLQGAQFGFGARTGGLFQRHQVDDLTLTIPDPVTRLVAEGGVDAGDGTVNPVATIAYALGQCRPGDTISVAAGTYTEHSIAVDRDVTITGSGAVNTIVQAAETLAPADVRVFLIQPELTVTMEALTIRHGWTEGDGGGLHASNCNLTLTDVILADNHSSSHGGGLSYYSDSGNRTLTLQRCRIQGNEALTGDRGNYGGGIRVESAGGTLNAGLLDTVITGNQAFDGGGAGLFCRGVTGTFLTLNRCRVSDNVGAGSALGGGLQVTCLSNSQVARLDIHQTTISGNTAGLAGGLSLGRVVANLVQCTVSGNRSRGLAGGIHAEATSCQLTLRHCTVADNQCDLLEAGGNPGGGLYLGPAGSVSLQGCIVAGNRQGTDPLGATADFHRSHANPNLISLGHNLTGSGTGFPTGNATDLFVDPATVFTTVLGPLADNGGPTPTHALLDYGPAIDAASIADLPADATDEDGDGNTAEPLPHDQRGAGFPRVVGGQVDIGAVEAALPPPPLPVAYVAPADSFTPANPAAGDTVTWNGPGGPVAGLVFGLEAHATIQAALAAVDAGGTVRVAAGTYTEHDLTLAQDVTLTGAGAGSTIVQAAVAPQTVFHRVFFLNPGITATLEDLTIRHGWSDSGGGLRASSGSLTLNGVTVAQNAAEQGGGLYLNADNGGLTLTLNGCVIRDNTATPVDEHAGGGGLILQGHHSTDVTLVNTTFSGNQTTGDGGGIYSRTFGTGNLTLIGCTLSGNTAGLSGGGLWTEHNWDVNLHQTTVSGNQAANNGGGYYLEQGYLACAHSTLAGNVCDSDDDGGGSGGGLYRVAGVTEIRGSLIAGNRKGPNAAVGGADVGGNVTSHGHNLTGSGTGFPSGNGDLTVPPATVFTHVVGPLANNGGPTLTHAPLAGSPAIGHGNSGDLPADFADLDGDGNTGEPVAFDQRGAGFPRVLGTRVDIGAVESDLPGLLAAYVAPAESFTPANPSAGDTVTWNGPGGPVSGLVFGLDASGSLRAAITAAADGGTVNVAAGTYTEPGLVVNTSLTLIGAGADVTFVEAAATPGTATDRVMFLNPGLSLTLQGFTLRHGKATEGGGLRATTGSLTLNDVVLADNEAGRGGGLFAWADTAALTLTLNRCVVRDNRATVAALGTVGGGGVFVMETAGRGLVAAFNGCAFTDNEAGTGAGGVFTGVAGVSTGTATATFRRCTFSGNHAGTEGGGLQMAGVTLQFDHCTVSGNLADGNGGGLFVLGAPSLLVHCTVADNGAALGGGIHGSPSVRGSVVAGNRAASDPAHANADVSGFPITLGHNLAGSGTGFPAGNATDVFVDPATVFTAVLNPLADNGGPLLTHALPVTSPAINAALNADLPADADDLDGDGDTAEAAPFDQRGAGFPRVIGGVADIGAVEGPSPYVYVDAAGDFTPANPAAGDLVTWQGPGGPVPGLVFGREAFTGLQTALQEMAVGGWLALAAGTYTEHDIVVDRDVTITGAGAANTIVQAAETLAPADVRVFFVNPEVTATLEALTIRHGWALGSGGGLGGRNCDLTLNDVIVADNHSGTHGGGLHVLVDSGDHALVLNRCVIRDNEAVPVDRSSYGGGLYVEAAGASLTAVLNDTVIVGNESESGGGGLGGEGAVISLTRCLVTDNEVGSGSGGGIILRSGTLHFNHSTLSGNLALGNGGGLSVGGTGEATAAHLDHCTVSGNQSGGHGGGLFTRITSQLQVRHSTITDNECEFSDVFDGDGGGIYSQSTANPTLQGCLVAGNRDGTSGTSSTADFGGTLTSLGHNLVGSGTGFPTGNVTDVFVDPATVFTTVLGPLADNGGPTPTHALLGFSPAIDAASTADLPADATDEDGDGNTTEPAPFDQRSAGFPRLLGAAPDIGALEAALFRVVAAADTVHRQPGRTIKIRLATLLANDLSPASHPLTVTAVSATSAGGVPLQMLNGVVLYAPAVDFNAADSFTYTVANGLETVTATVSVIVDAPTAAPTLNLTGTFGTPGFPGQVRVNAAAIPGRRYVLQATSNLTPPVTWNSVAPEQVANETGQVSFGEDNPPSPRFYRVVEVELP